MSPTLRLSVALPVYNGADFLEAAVASVLAQSARDFELVISDNASTDATPEIAHRFAAGDSRVRHSRSETFLDQAENVNRSVELCANEWVKLLCHDDLLTTDCLAVIGEAAAAARATTGLIGNGEAWLFANGVVHRASPEIPRLPELEGRSTVRQTLRGKGRVPLPSLTTATVRKSAWKQAGGFDSRFVHFDVFLWHRLLMQWDYLYLPEVLTHNRIHGAQVAAQARRSAKVLRQQEEFYREFLDEFAAELALGGLDRSLMRLRPPAYLASTVAVALLRSDFRQALKLLQGAPIWSVPLMPALVWRSYWREAGKVSRLRGSVPVELIYP